MEKRRTRQRLQRLTIVPPPADWELVIVDLDAATIARLDALTARVRAGDVPPALAQHLATRGAVETEAPLNKRRTAVLKLITAALSTLMLSGCVAPIDIDSLFDDDGSGLTTTPDAGTDAPTPVVDAGTDAAAQPVEPQCFPLAWIEGANPADYACQGGMVVTVCFDAPTQADGSLGAPMVPEGCYGPNPWVGAISVNHAHTNCCPAK